MLALSKSPRAERLVTTSPLTADVVRRYVASDIGAVVDRLTRQGLLVSVDHLGEEVTDEAQAEATVATYVALGADLAGPHHTPTFDLDEAALALGVDFLERLVRG